MPRIRHRSFQIYDFLQEANDALASKSARINTYSLDPDLWRFRQLDVQIRPTGVAHVTFKPRADVDSDSGSDVELDFANDLGRDLADLADLLTNGSRAVLDFEGVETFNADAIAKLSDFNGKLTHKGSRFVLCNLGPTTRDSFFPNARTKANS
ncbi:hypothetical protein [Planctomycetes bacterium K23_9]|uniref:STAS domain-containing protein n=1 Tax=Stieleria marina TaxID=1930275 RepID=A0A517NPI1_9BACT|nr:hypothetical protein K239x_09690 [Planctomycetes bacterium K23_9]